jgi:hypothetical protein
LAVLRMLILYRFGTTHSLMFVSCTLMYFNSLMYIQ